MKRFLFALLTILVANASVSAYAQQKGDKYIGSMIGFSMQKVNTYENFEGMKIKAVDLSPMYTFVAQPGFHYFASDKFRIGLEAEFMRRHQKSNDNEYYYEHTELAFMLGATAAKYIQLSDCFYYVIEGGAYYAYATTATDMIMNNEDNEGMGFTIAFQPLQFEMKPSERIGISVSLLSLAFAHLNVDTVSDYEVFSNTFSMDIGVTPSVGVHFYL